MTIDQSTMLDLFRRLSLCREFEATLIEYATKDGKPVGHPYMGEEAVAAGVCTALRPGDRVMSGHRAHGHAVAKGCDLALLALELYGSGEGTCRGRAGEMFVSEPRVGYFGGNQIVGGNVAMAAGLAMAAQLSGEDRIAVAFVGDGGVNQGVVHEALNLAAIWALPLIVVVENNGYAQTTSIDYALAGSIVGRAAAVGIGAVSIDGQSAIDIYQAATAARQQATSGGGPTLIEARTYRYEGHYYGDRHLRYRTKAEVDSWLARDPVAIHRRLLVESGVEETLLVGITADARRASVAAMERARTGREVTLADLLDGVFVTPGLDAIGGAS